MFSQFEWKRLSCERDNITRVIFNNFIQFLPQIYRIRLSLHNEKWLYDEKSWVYLSLCLTIITYFSHMTSYFNYTLMRLSKLPINSLSLLLHFSISVSYFIVFYYFISSGSFSIYFFYSYVVLNLNSFKRFAQKRIYHSIHKYRVYLFWCVVNVQSSNCFTLLTYNVRKMSSGIFLLIHFMFTKPIFFRL